MYFMVFVHKMLFKRTFCAFSADLTLILYALLRMDYGLQLLQAVKMDPAESQLSF